MKPVKEPKQPVEEKQVRGFTEEEKINIIQLANRGESPKSIAKMFKRKPSVISGYLWKLRKEGLVTKTTTPLPEIDL